VSESLITAGKFNVTILDQHKSQTEYHHIERPDTEGGDIHTKK